MLSSMHDDRMYILHLERTILALRAEKAVVQARLDAYKFPVLTLPNEITSEIFIHFLPTYPEPPPLAGLASPTSLTHVCSKWRQVALATPALWRAIKLDPEDEPNEQFRHISDAWIRRSGSLPLSLVLNTDNRNFLHEIFTDPLAMATERCEHVDLWVSLPALPRIGAPMPMLRSLEFAVYTFGDVFTFYEAPQLRNVVLRGRISSLVVLPWIQLTSLTLNYAEVNKCVEILTQTLNLVRCVLIIGDYNPGLDEVTTDGLDLALPRLESLVMKHSGPPEQIDAGFLPSFVVPSLCQLELQEIFLGENPIHELKSFISKSRCTLQEVCILISPDTTADDHDYRSAFPSIPTFTFAFADGSDCDED
ncbi:hypothetical protein C8R45DRAFT_578403 [Mycena sanguinolenta]|nr:hypothetical protein C8R45DRAFT_578403 [Mycena sanguinolenta]